MTRAEEIRVRLDTITDQLIDLVGEVMEEYERQDDLLMRVANVYAAEGRLLSTPQAISAWLDGDRQDDPPGTWSMAPASVPPDPETST